MNICIFKIYVYSNKHMYIVFNQMTLPGHHFDSNLEASDCREGRLSTALFD